MKDEDEELQDEEAKLNREEAEERMEIVSEHLKELGRGRFCMADAFDGLASTMPTTPEQIMERGADRTFAEFNIDVFDQTFHGFQAIIDRFGCGAAGVQALKGVISYYSMILEVAEKHEKFCEDKLKRDTDKLNKLL